MFIISENTKITGKENVRSISHLEHCLCTKGLHGVPVYDYFGTHVLKGGVLVNTADGDVFVKFNAKDGIAREISITKAVTVNE